MEFYLLLRERVSLYCFSIDRLFEEIVFQLPDDNGSVIGESVEDFTHEPLRFAVHPAGDRPMIAMATVNYGDLKIKVCQLCFSSFL